MPEVRSPVRSPVQYRAEVRYPDLGRPTVPIQKARRPDLGRGLVPIWDGPTRRNGRQVVPSACAVAATPRQRQRRLRRHHRHGQCSPHPSLPLSQPRHRRAPPRLRQPVVRQHGRLPLSSISAVVLHVCTRSARTRVGPASVSFRARSCLSDTWLSPSTAVSALWPVARASVIPYVGIYPLACGCLESGLN